jgi:protoporphyrinogen oxidase
MMKKKLCIIGAGLSGLTAGRNILSLTNTIDITIIEKSFKVSGRATSRLIKDYLFDSGATTINEINHPLLNPIFKNLDIKKI